MWPFRRRVNPADGQEIVSRLERARAGKRYSPQDRYRDFRQVFLGSDQGMRVLYEIIGWGNQFQSSAEKGSHDPYKTAFHEGQRSLAIKIIFTLGNEPKARPASTKEK